MLILISFFITGFIIGAICEYVYDYYRNMNEFNKRQERNRRML